MANISPEKEKKLKDILAGEGIQKRNSSMDSSLYKKPPETVNSKVEEERNKLLNKALEQDIALKKNTLVTLFSFLAVETIIVLFFAFLQGLKVWDFHLEEWSFRLIVTATLTHTTIMLQVAVKHLFPEKIKPKT